MSFRTRHTIGARLLLAFAFSTSLLTIVSLVAWGTWSRLDYQVEELLNQSVPKYNTSMYWKRAAQRFAAASN